MKLNFIDTHAHLYDEQFDADRDEAIRKAIEHGVEKIFLPNCDSSTIEGMNRLSAQWPENCYPMMGLHPCYVKENFRDELDRVEKELSQRRYYAVGEIGLDYYWDKTFVNQQKQAFEYQIDLALQHELPIVIHTRESIDDGIQIVKAKQKGSLSGVFHCFSGTVNQANSIIESGLLLGIGGVATFKKTALAEVIAAIPLEHIVLETDAPYLAPVPYRGKRNESSYIPYVAAKIAELKQCSIEEVARMTTANANQLFKQQNS